MSADFQMERHARINIMHDSFFCSRRVPFHAFSVVVCLSFLAGAVKPTP